MWNKVVSWLLSLYSLFYPGPGPCPSLQLMPANTLDQQQFLGKWYFRAAASRHQAHIAKFKPLDSLWFSMEKSGNDTLLLTGHMHMKGKCMTESWTYRVHMHRDDLELEGKAHRRNLLWSGRWANCPECIILQEAEPEEALNRLLLYARHRDADPDVVAAFLRNAACHNMSAKRYTSLGKRIVRLKIKNELGAALPTSVCNSWITAGFRVRSVSRVLLQPGPQREIKTVSMCRVRSWTVLNEPSAVLEAF
ncbi:unnamed protein product [Tetraodon nigroviridis]|uniref:Apolipoprotein M n=2 Tax=Tetraodon nigroviridis TaxID=99883 RepID=Q4S9D7_TETNG|nr:unnamed protein product [Tetraodon nigroviridis]